MKKWLDTKASSLRKNCNYHNIAIFANNCILESNYIMIKCAKNAMILIIRKELKLVI